MICARVRACVAALERALCAMDPPTPGNLNVIAWEVALTAYASVPPSPELVSVLSELHEFTYSEPVVRGPHLRFVHWEVRSRCHPLDELDQHVEDVLAQVRHRHTELAQAVEHGGEIVLEVRGTPPTEVSLGLLLESRHVAELGVIRAGISVEAADR